MGVVIGVGSSVVGFGLAVRLAGIGAALVSGVGGLLCLYVASRSPPVPAEPVDPTEG